jgi:glycosyltransferase involved in cell wall biosynthesis
MAKEWRLEAGRLRIIRNPIDTEQFRPDERANRTRSQSILFAGHLQWYKGGTTLVAAIPRVLHKHPAAHFLFVGNDTKSGPNRTSFRAHMENELRQAGALSHVSFVDPLPAVELVKRYRACAGLVLPSFQEVYGNVVGEAMACGRPCVVSSTAGSSELITSGKNGFVVPPGDSEQLAAALSELLGLSDEAHARMGSEARATVETLCSASVIATNTVSVYRETLLAEGRERRR